MNSMKEQEIEDFMEIADQIPFKKVQSLKLKNITFNLESSLFSLQIQKKCEGLPKENVSIERTLHDMNWLIYKIELQNKLNLVLPVLPEKSYWESLKSITQNLAKNSKTKLKKDEQKIFLCKCVARFITLVGEVIVKNLARYTNSSYNSIFTFFDEKYKLYRLQVYQKDEGTNLAKISQKLTTGSKKIFDYINPWKNTKKTFLQAQSIKLQKITQKVKLFINELFKMDSSLKLLSDNFFNEQGELKQKEIDVYTVFIKFSTILKVLQLMKLQLANTIDKSNSDLGLDQGEVKEQLNCYGKKLLFDLEQEEKDMNRLIKQFYLLIRQKKVVSISVSNIYHSSQGK